jgi:heme/copper-type cytochrome/quinol oxidase subunit 1
MMFFDPHAAPPSWYDPLFWFLGHAETHYLILPGFVWAVVAGMSRQRLLSLLGLATAVAGGLFVWIKAAVHLSPVMEGSFIPAAMIIPVAGTVLWIAGGREDSTRYGVSAQWMLGAVFMYVTGGITSFLLTGEDRALTVVYYLDWHLHQVLTLAAVFVIGAGWYRFFPTITGYSYPMSIARLHFWATVAGLFTLFFAGLLMETSVRRSFSDENVFARLNLFFSVGAWISLLAFLIFIYGAAVAVWRRQKVTSASANLPLNS